MKIKTNDDTFVRWVNDQRIDFALIKEVINGVYVSVFLTSIKGAPFYMNALYLN